ncbi:MAG TPA: FAD/NAD(P)-binding oxidoreductase [Rubrivivax sp.]|nr:FAD/NAD(P)-binding oxidoreductase [Rubrivivax sp.]
MHRSRIKGALSRRHLMGLAAGGLTAGLLPLRGWADDDEDDDQKPSAGSTSAPVLASTGLSGQRIVVAGGGMAGMTVAKYLRLWGGSGVQVTLVEPDAVYTSSIMSNLVLNGSRTIDSLRFKRDALTTKYGVVRKAGQVVAVNASARTVTVSDQSVLAYDRLVLAPGVSFDDAYGLTQADYETRTPHAWRAGTQTTLLRNQVAAMRNGDIFVMTIPKSPYRCPPGPYERACVVADYLKRAKGPNCKVLVLDENLAIQAERHTFELAFSTIHAGVIEYVPGVSHTVIDPNTKRVSYVDPVGGTQVVPARVVNPIVPHRASGSAPGGWLAQAGLNNSADGRWANVDVLSYESTAPGAQGIHVIGDASSCGMPKAGHVANQEAKICADAMLRLLAGGQPFARPVANSACYSPITATKASWLTAVYQYDATERKMKIASNGGQTLVNGVPAAATESASIDGDNFENMGIWFKTLMSDTTA